MTWGRRTTTLAAVLLLVAAGRPLQAQWVQPPGAGWVSVALYHHDTSTEFGLDGERQRFFEDGQAVTTSLYVTAALGLVRGVDAWVQVPVSRLAFSDILGTRTATGLGDPRLFLRIGSGLAGWSLPVPLAVRGGLKLPGRDFPVDAQTVPLTEGQVDWELMLELGHAFAGRPLYLMGWAGHRWRMTDPDIDRKPGDEWFAYAAAGGQWRRFPWKLAVEAWTGGAPRVQGLVLRSSRRQMLQVLPTLGISLGPGVLEAGLRVPIAGRNFPAGPAIVAGYFVTWNRK